MKLEFTLRKFVVCEKKNLSFTFFLRPFLFVLGLFFLYFNSIVITILLLIFKLNCKVSLKLKFVIIFLCVRQLAVIKPNKLGNL